MTKNTCILLIALWSLATQIAHAQCVPTCAEPCPCPPNPPPGICYVVSEQQLRDALNGISECPNCDVGVPTHIEVPAGVRICMTQSINLPSNFTLTINGTLTWAGETPCGEKMINISNRTNGHDHA